MFRPTDVLQPKPGERILAVLRPHGSVLWPTLAGAALLIVLPFLFLFTLTTWGWFGWAVFGACVLTGMFLAWRAVRRWDADVLIVTTQRLVDVDQRGIWARVVREVPMAAIVDVRTERRGLMDVFWRVGVLSITCISPSPEIKVCMLSRPEQVRELILTARGKATQV